MATFDKVKRHNNAKKKKNTGNSAGWAALRRQQHSGDGGVQTHVSLRYGHDARASG